MSQKYDVIVIGAGSAGLTSAVGFVKVGKRVLLVESEHMGGECTNSGCVPSKALLHHAKTYHAAQKIVLKNGGGGKSMEAYRTRALAYVQEKIAEFLAHERVEDFEKMGIDVVMGEAVFEGPRSVRVGAQCYTFTTAIIATGSSPRRIDIPGLKEGDRLTNQNVFALTEIPKRLCIIGAGPIGMELGQAFALLGAQVTIIAREERFAVLEDKKIAAVLQKKFEEHGITILLKAHVTRVEDGSVVTLVRTGNKEKEVRIVFDKVLLAIGRVPNIPRGLDEADVAYDEHAVIVNGQHQTSNKKIFAIGDVAQRLKFTHTADDAARQVIMRVVSHGLVRVGQRKAVPKVTYTLPEVAAVGLSYEMAVQVYGHASVLRVDVPFADNDRAKTDEQTEGHMVVIVRRMSGRVLGVNIIGQSAGELIALFTLAIDQKISLWQLRRTIYAYPTYGLLVKRAGDLFFAQTLMHLKTDVAHILKKHAPKIIALAVWSVVLAIFHQYRMTHDLSFREMLIVLYDIVTTTTWGPIVYMAVYAIRPIIFFPATLLTALSGLLFGLPLGILYTVIGENASANIAYWIGRFFGSDLALENSFMGKWIEALRKRPFTAVLFMRLFYVPFDLTNYGAGILRVRWAPYALATVIGIVPGLTTFVALGAGIKDIRTFNFSAASFDFVSLGIAISVFVVSLGLSRILKRWHNTQST